MVKSLSLVILLASQTFCLCPISDLLYPCTCDVMKREISCTGMISSDQLLKIFQTLEKRLRTFEKYFHRFHLSSLQITNLEEMTFKDTIFNSIEIVDCPFLKTIHEDAFHGTDKFTSRLLFKNLPALNSDKNSIFKIVGKFERLQDLELTNIDLAEIPHNAFRPLKNPELTDLRFYGSSFKKIGNNAFYHLERLEQIRFDQAEINNISSFAFRIFEGKQLPSPKLIIDFSNCPNVNSSVFSAGSLSSINRRTRLLFGDHTHRQQITYLNENAFRPFLMENKNNSIELRYQDLDCNDCRNQWLKNNQDLLKRIELLKCSDEKDLDDTGHFKQCNLIDNN